MTYSEVMVCTNTCFWGFRMCIGGFGGRRDGVIDILYIGDMSLYRLFGWEIVLF